jgi:hypothetical protein
LYPTTSSDSTPQQILDPYCWESKWSETQGAQDPSQTDCKCYACGERGHYANQFTPTPTRGANYVLVAAKQNYTHGRVNHVVVEEAQEAPDVVLSVFFINATSVVVLFDSGASHSFISATYVEKHNLPIVLLKCQMIDSSLGGDMPTRQLCLKVNLKIRG